jgi:transcriptional regulator with XRE-family HTH domain
LTETPGQRIARLRKERDLTQQALATKARVSVSAISQIEQGRRAGPALRKALAKALRTTQEEIWPNE